MTWEGESEEDARGMECAYKGEIEKLSGERMDLACLPLDGRQGEKFALGFDFFMRHVETAHAYPMHYWDDEAVVDRLLSLPCSEPYRQNRKGSGTFAVRTRLGLIVIMENAILKKLL